MENPQVVQGTIATTNWIFYHLKVPEGVTSLSVSLSEEDDRGYLALYLNGGSIPSLTTFYSSTTGYSKVKNVYYVVNSGETRDYFIGVYGTSLLPLSKTASFKLGFYSPHISFS